MYWNNSKPTIGRIYVVSPMNLELFRLRQLLLARTGCTSFKDIRTPHLGKHALEHPTFFGAAKALGSMVDGEEWHNCLNEADMYAMPRMMQNLSCAMCVYLGV
jgi:hypothetical protein